MDKIILILLIAVYALLRVFGGRDDKTLEHLRIPFDNRTWKRWIAPAFLYCVCLGHSVVAGSFHSVYLLCLIGFAGGDGYGNDSGVRWREVLQRILSALASTAPAIAFCLGSKTWHLLFIQLALALTVKITLNFVKLKPWKKKIKGVEIDGAIQEEYLINFFDSVLKPFMV